MSLPKQIADDFVVLTPDKQAHIEPADAGLYGRLDGLYSGFVGHELIACHSFSQDWGSWEMHPHGDEIVILLDGAVCFVLHTQAGERDVVLREQGQYVLVPKGVWHTAKIIAPAKLLFITPGQGTEHRPA